MLIEEKLTILADAAKYDVSCASSGSRRQNNGRRLGNAAPCGICHTYTEDGRCVSLLKILYTNACIYDCAYCANRLGSDIPRAAFTPAEIVSLTIDFYRRNYIEGLFLSSGIMCSPDDTMERLVRTVRDLRSQEFNGYIHLKCVPYASRRLIRQAGRYADRLSVNIELPSEMSLRRLTRDKTYASVLTPMETIRDTIFETGQDRRRLRHVPEFAPAGQSTQLIIGASPETDYDILNLARRLYRRQCLKRVYYSAYVPVKNAGNRLPDIDQPPLQRENRLYQADWLMRLYGFSFEEVIGRDRPHLDLKIDPKQAFALRNPALFPVDVNRAEHEMILRVPGIGLKSARRIIDLRRKGRIRFEHLRQLGVVTSRAQPFIRVDGLPKRQWPSAAVEKRSGRSQPALSRVFVTDGTFDGLLSAVFEAYAAAQPPDAIETTAENQMSLFDHRIEIGTDPEKSERVWQGLKKHLGCKGRRRLLQAFLSESPGVETDILHVVLESIPGRDGGRQKARINSRIRIDKLALQVRREAHRMKGFIRFQQTGQDRYLALIAPRYDVLPLIQRHFETRFADQIWTVYDRSRNYGLCYDRHRTRRITVDAKNLTGVDPGHPLTEQLCRRLWQRYFAAVNIAARNNPQLHLSRLPRRFWRYLPEKQR